MLFDIRRIQAHTLKEFAREYVMIVVGILTALAMEHWATQRHDRERAEAAHGRLVAELRGNLERVHQSLASNQERLKRLTAALPLLAQAGSAHLAQAELDRLVVDRLGPEIIVGENLPALRHEAWDVAVADQSIGHIPLDELSRLSAAYVAQRDFSAVNENGGLYLQVIPRVVEVMTDARSGDAAARDLARVVNLQIIGLQIPVENLHDLESKLTQALQDAPAGSHPR